MFNKFAYPNPKKTSIKGLLRLLSMNVYYSIIEPGWYPNPLLSGSKLNFSRIFFPICQNLLLLTSEKNYNGQHSEMVQIGLKQHMKGTNNKVFVFKNRD